MDSDNSAGDSGHSPFPPGFRPKLPTLNENKDDLDAYLYRFEKHTETCRWQTSLLGIYLVSLLTGKALSVYHSLSLSMTQEHNALKTQLLKKFQCTKEDFRERVLFRLP